MSLWKECWYNDIHHCCLEWLEADHTPCNLFFITDVAFRQSSSRCLVLYHISNYSNSVSGTHPGKCVPSNRAFKKGSIETLPLQLLTILLAVGLSNVMSNTSSLFIVTNIGIFSTLNTIMLSIISHSKRYSHLLVVSVLSQTLLCELASQPMMI